MNPVTEINHFVDVIAIFRTKSTRTSVQPLRMRYDGHDITFTKLGLCHPVRHGSRLCYVFNVSDGTNDYSLELDTTTLQWKLLSLIDGSYL